MLPLLESPVDSCRMPVGCTTLGSRHADMSSDACHMPAEWAARQSRHDGMQPRDPRDQHEKVGCGGGCPGGEYWGHKCVAWRKMIVEAMRRHGMSLELCSFVLLDNLGFDETFGKMVYAWDARRGRVQWMLSYCWY